MPTTQNCPQCGRLSATTAPRCIYCGTILAKHPDEESPTPSANELARKAEAAKTLLAGLSPEARAMMPGDVLAKLEADARLETADPSSDPSPAVVAVEPNPTGPITEVLPTESRPEASPATVPVAPLPDAANERIPLVLEGLRRGGGPFGPRGIPVRLILLPDPRYARRSAELRDLLHQELGLDLYTSNQVLQKPIPSYLGPATNRTQGELRIAPLKEAGLRIVVLERDKWLEGAEPDYVVGARAETEGFVTFDRADGSTLEMRRGSVRWAALAPIRPGAAGPGTLPSPLSEDDVPGLDQHQGSYLLLDLLRKGVRRPIRMRSDQFDFTCLGPDRQLSANLNFRRMLSWLTPQPDNPEQVIPLDEAFRRVPHLPGAPIQGPGPKPAIVDRREVEFTEYVLMLDARHHF